MTFSVLGSQTVTIAAGKTQTVTVQLTADASLMKHTRDATVPPTQLNEARAWLSEAQGYLKLTPTGAPAGRPVLRVPLYATVRPASTMTAANSGSTSPRPAPPRSV